VPGAAKQVPMQEGLYTWPSSEPQLIASKCAACGEVAFPRQVSCPACAAEDAEEILLSRRGKLWTWTIQHFPPPTPPFAGDRASFAPFGVGYIELPEGVRVESRLTVNEPERLAIGMEMELVVEKFTDAEDGSERMTFAFQPVAD
jgi:uncharacterized OB-fold protein